MNARPKPGGYFKVDDATAVVGRLRAVAHRFQNDAGWFPWRGVADLAAIHYVLAGNEAELVAHLDAYARARRTVVRVASQLADPGWGTFVFNDGTPGYVDARERVRQLVNERGMYLELIAFCDAQDLQPDYAARERHLRDFATFCAANVGVVPQLSNEPWKNGWTEAVDPQLLQLADLFASLIGHRDFSIGDPTEDDTPDVGGNVVQKFQTLARHSNILVIHPDRFQHGETSRWRRWVEHLEGFTDVLAQCGNADAAFVLDEPNGANAVYQDGRRENDPDAFRAAQAEAVACGLGYTYHWIPDEANQFAAADLPGLDEAFLDVLVQMPVSPEWTYKNDSWAGAPEAGIRWKGLTGKVRNLVNGAQAWTVAFGEGDWNSIGWRPGDTPTLVYSTDRVAIWKVNQ